jgi:hypothetical protein
MDKNLTDAVFAAAAESTLWTRTNLGLRTHVSHARYTWTVQLPAEGAGVARITGRNGYGGSEFCDVPATLPQSIPIVDMACAAARPGVSWPVFTLQRWDWAAESWQTRGEYTSERGEGNAYFAVAGERASDTGPIRLLKDGVAMVADDPDTYYDRDH